MGPLPKWSGLRYTYLCSFGHPEWEEGQWEVKEVDEGMRDEGLSSSQHIIRVYQSVCCEDC